MKHLFTLILYALFFIFLLNNLVFSALENNNCLNCHLNMDPKVDKSVLENSVHNKLNCISCHSDVKAIPHQKKIAPVNCGNCHSDIVSEITGEKGNVHFKDEKGKPSCKDCHGTHDIYPKDNNKSKINKLNVSKLCLNCHSDIERYNLSIHNKALLSSGLANAPTCTDCHGAHIILPSNNVNSKTYFTNIPELCGDCHRYILDRYINSIHGKLLKEGNPNVPVCTTCHSEHEIYETSRITLFGIETKECGNCHLEQSKIYQDNYHGRATLMGFVRSALCTDCHDKHLILPKEDPQSSINKSNLDETCGKCHGYLESGVYKTQTGVVTSSFDKYKIHTSFSQAVIFKISCLLVIFVAILGFIIHYLIFGSKEFNEEEKIYWFNFWNRFVHWSVAITFVILVITGIIIIFADNLGGGIIILITRYIHRITAFLFIIFDILMIIMWRKYFITKPYDIKWLMMLGGYLSKKKKVVPADKFNFGQKLWLILSSIGGVILFITGIVILSLPPDVKLLQVSIYIHNIIGIILVGFFMIHLYMSVFVIKGSIKTMITGYKPKEEAEYMHGYALKDKT
ncbi:MAG: formate dehydrogenase subunit gamma [Deferribacterota bacterium]|nr:formate dehydrogenase subunit gamma [Deferribacterota bacterium]